MLSSEELIKITNVSKSFPVKNGKVEALRDVDVTIKRGSFTILCGPSGSGKSTLLNIIAGLEAPTSGTVTFGGTDIYKLTNNQRASYRTLFLGVVFQSNYWINSLSTLENVAAPRLLLGTSYNEAVAAAKKALDRLKMSEHASTAPGLLSGGQQQRIQMARALVNDSPVILGDEPTGNLDTANGDMVMNLLSRCRDEMGQTIILATHNLEYLPLSDSQIYVKDGMVAQNFGPARMPSSSILRMWKNTEEKAKKL